MAQELSQYYEEFSKLDLGQIGVQNERLAIDVVARLVHTVRENWEQKKLAAALFMDVKRAFDYVSECQLHTCMIELGVDGNLRLERTFF